MATKNTSILLRRMSVHMSRRLTRRVPFWPTLSSSASPAPGTVQPAMAASSMLYRTFTTSPPPPTTTTINAAATTDAAAAPATTSSTTTEDNKSVDSSKLPETSSSESSSSSSVDLSKFTEEIKVRMPDMGNGEGRVLKWYRTEGEIVKRGDVLCDIETPDFTFGMETDDEHLSIMGKILVEAPSDPIKEKAVICILLHEPSTSSKKKKKD